MKIVIVASIPSSLVHFRGHMISAMREKGHGIVAVAPVDDERTRVRLSEMGVTFEAVPMSRTGLNPLRDAQTVSALYSLFKRHEADMVLAYTAKPVVYGLIAARLAGVGRRVALISGRGSVLAGGAGAKRRFLSRILQMLYRIGLRNAGVVFFQNPDDLEYFRSKRLVGRNQRLVVVNGSGVDLSHYQIAPLPDGPMTFLMIGRLLRDKGVYEYVEAARRVRSAGVDARFELLGAYDTSPSSISPEQMQTLEREGVVKYLGTTDDVRSVIATAHAAVLPSYYGEGVPRSILECMSMGRAVITTDEPGCRETVEPGRNGVLVSARNAEAVADAMLGFVQEPELVAEMGRQSRLLAEERFDVHEVNRLILDALDL